MLSKDCGNCISMRWCMIRYKTVVKGERVFCADGTAHLVDQDAPNYGDEKL
jgi:hypothetical protein